MNSKAKARCSNGHIFEWGTCKAEKRSFFGGIKRLIGNDRVSPQHLVVVNEQRLHNHASRASCDERGWGGF